MTTIWNLLYRKHWTRTHRGNHISLPKELHLLCTGLCSSKLISPGIKCSMTSLAFKKIVKHDSWPIQPHILSPPLLRLTSRKPLWLDLQPVDIKSRWRHNWKSAQVVNSHLVCDPTIQRPGFDLPRQQWSLLNRFRTKQGHCMRCLQKEIATYRHWSVFLWRDPDDVPHCRILSPDKTEWRLINHGYTLRMKTLFRGLPVMAHDTHTRLEED